MKELVLCTHFHKKRAEDPNTILHMSFFLNFHSPKCNSCTHNVKEVFIEACEVNNTCTGSEEMASTTIVIPSSASGFRVRFKNCRYRSCLRMELRRRATDRAAVLTLAEPRHSPQRRSSDRPATAAPPPCNRRHRVAATV